MRQLCTIALCAALAAPAAAQEQGEMSEGLSLLEEGTRLFLRGLMAEIEPALDELRQGLMALDGYHAPEILPNGDIIIRRKRGPEDPEGPAPDEIEF